MIPYNFGRCSKEDHASHTANHHGGLHGPCLVGLQGAFRLRRERSCMCVSILIFVVRLWRGLGFNSLLEHCWSLSGHSSVGVFLLRLDYKATMGDTYKVSLDKAWRV